MKPLLWFRVQLDGRSIPVVLSSPKLTKDLRGALGLTMGRTDPHILQIIYIDAGCTRETQDWVLFHELMIHGVLWESPVKRSVEQEEKFAHALGPRAMSVLRQVGFSWPRRPAGAARLERWARKYARG